MTEGVVRYVGDDIIGKHTRWVARAEDFTPPTYKEEDCICGGHASGGRFRTLIANCPCCDGIQVIREEICPCDGTANYHKIKVLLPPNGTMRIRYIDSEEPIS
jgi:hypothetical protein